MASFVAKRTADYDNTSQKRTRLSTKANQSLPRVGGSPQVADTNHPVSWPHCNVAADTSEVASDFQDSLRDLQLNNRYEISNLTIIAKENAEHAAAISRALEDHITRTPPSRKLPALYVLDSIVKNVGTPYTVYLGRNLYSTFMDSYTLMDSQTRKNMEAMLKTWKDPIPGSMDTKPVFPIEITRSIENTLIKARTAAVEQQREHMQRQKYFYSPLTRPDRSGQSPPPYYDNQVCAQYGFHSLSPPESDPPKGIQFLRQFQLGPQSTYAPLQDFPPLPVAASATGMPSSPLISTAVSSKNIPPGYQATQQPTISMLEEYSATHARLLPQQFNNNSSAQQTAWPKSAAHDDLATVLSGMHPGSSVPLSRNITTSTHVTSPPVDPLASIKTTFVSLKAVRPNMADALYLPNMKRCLQCGRGFSLNSVGRARKMRHDDAHFNNNRRLAEAAHTSMSRSWFIDETEWIAYREPDDARDVLVTLVMDDAKKQVSDNINHTSWVHSSQSSEQYVKVPADASSKTYVCPTCQEPFDENLVFHATQQDWVWIDAVLHLGNIYHVDHLP